MKSYAWFVLLALPLALYVVVRWQGSREELDPRLMGVCNACD
jgi:hypothetical protein